MFTSSCFIKKNTLELRETLKELGYKFSNSLEETPDKYIGLFAAGGHLIGIPKEFLNEKIIKMIGNTNDYFNCKTNEKLFIALASLRDDSDKNQWFKISNWINENDEYIGDWWVLCTESTFEEFGEVNNDTELYNRKKFNWLKASASDIITYFK